MGAMRYLRVVCLLLLMVTVGYAQGPSTAPAGTGDLLKARVFSAERGTARVMANGGESRDILHAALATGEAVSMHESRQLPGAKPNPPHTIQHSEFIVVLEGTLAFEHDGLSEQAGSGNIIYVAYGTLHTVRNIGTTPAKYLVIAIGGDQKS
jgi:mannose-6-phosphate isomerase-like protein (cupin superfamily)